MNVLTPAPPSGDQVPPPVTVTRKGSLYTRYLRRMTREESIDLLAESITKIVRFSVNQTFREDCFGLLEVTNSTDFDSALKEQLVKCVEDNPPGGKRQRKPKKKPPPQEDQEHAQIDSVGSATQAPELLPPLSSFTCFDDEGLPPTVFDILTLHSQEPLQTYADLGAEPEPGTSGSNVQKSADENGREILTESPKEELSPSLLGPGWAWEAEATEAYYPAEDHQVVDFQFLQDNDDAQNSGTSSQVSESLLQNLDMDELMLQLQEVNDTYGPNASKRQATSATDSEETYIQAECMAVKLPRLDEDLNDNANPTPAAQEHKS